MYFFGIFILIITFIVIEKVLHERRLNRIPMRIHVNGIRGKTSVTQLVAAMLRKAGIRTLAKTTGNEPVLIYPDGHEEIISRRGPPRIQEQIQFIKKAAKLNVGAVVAECMALDPQLQLVSEEQMIKSTLGVITNVRPDHLEVMGWDLDDIAESLSQSIPRDGILVTGDPKYFTYFKSRAAEKNTKTYLAEDIKDFSPQKNRKKGYIFRENYLIAKKVCSLLGASPSVVHNKSCDSFFDRRDSGTIIVRNVNNTLYFIDAFSANDIDSTRIIQRIALNEKKCPRPYIALLNNRADRPLRMLSFVSYLSQEPTYNYIMLIGDNQRMAKRYFRREGKKENIIILESRNSEKLIQEIYHKLSTRTFTMVGMGNYKGLGGEISRFIKHRGEK